jgi:hypothetical protein
MGVHAGFKTPAVFSWTRPRGDSMQLKLTEPHRELGNVRRRKHRHFPTCYLSGSSTMRRSAARIQIVNLMIFSHRTKESMNSSGSPIKESGQGGGCFLLLTPLITMQSGNSKQRITYYFTTTHAEFVKEARASGKQC